MAPKTDKLIQFFEQLKTLTFWQRLFKWSQFKSRSYEAYEEFKLLLHDFSNITQVLESTKTDYSLLKNDNEHIKVYNSSLENDLKNLNEKLNDLQNKNSELTSALAAKDESVRQEQKRNIEQAFEIDSLNNEQKKLSDIIQGLNSQIATKDESLRQSNDKIAKLDLDSSVLKDKLTTSSEKLSDLTSSLATKDEALRQAETKMKNFEIEVASYKEKINSLTQDHSQLKQQNTIFIQTEEDRKSKYEKDVAALNTIISQIQEDRKKEIEIFQQREINRLNQLKETWTKHEENVKNILKILCERHTIEYVEKVPFKGNPDNTIKICDEFVIFDAKSPASDDLNNFPAYIKAQTESVKKYVKEENVKKDIFLVIPSNTVEVINPFSYNMADYNVFVITINALEPIILSLKKLEDYKFIEDLSPEERDNICRVVGKFAHLTKRRIQIDQFFERQFLEALNKCEVDLPHEILTKVVEYERSEKLNPPTDKRAKLISNKELESDSKKIRKEAEAKAIQFPDSMQQEIKSLPLYEDESPNGNNSNRDD